MSLTPRLHLHPMGALCTKGALAPISQFLQQLRTVKHTSNIFKL